MRVPARSLSAALLVAAGLIVPAASASAAADMELRTAESLGDEGEIVVGKATMLYISARNNGPGPATNVVVKAVDLPASFTPTTGDPYCSDPVGLIGCATAPGYFINPPYGWGTNVVGVPHAVGTFTFKGVVTSNDDPNPVNDVRTGTFTVVPDSGRGGRGGGGGEEGNGDDTSAPRVTLSGKKSQKLGKSVAVTVRCSTTCRVTATGTVGVPKVYRLRKATRSARARRKVTLRLKVSAKARRAAKRALRRHRKVRAKIKVSAKDSAGNRTSKKRTIRLTLR